MCAFAALDFRKGFFEAIEQFDESKLFNEQRAPCRRKWLTLALKKGVELNAPLVTLTNNDIDTLLTTAFDTRSIYAPQDRCCHLAIMWEDFTTTL